MTVFEHAQTSYFQNKFGITDRLIEQCLGEALSAGGEYAELYFESVASTSLGVDESLVKAAAQGVSAGCGIRVLSGERTGYAYTDELSPERLSRAARTAALIASGPAKQAVVGLQTDLSEATRPRLYPAPAAELDSDLGPKLALVMRADAAARAADPRITEVRASYGDEVRRILVAASDGTYTSDVQPLTHLLVFVLAKDGEKTVRGSASGGGRVDMSYFDEVRTPEYFAQEAVRQALLQLVAVAAPAGDMEVVLGPGSPGVLLHEAVGHGLEADFNRKKTSAFSGMIGQRVAGDKVTVIDSGTIPSQRGSIHVDDEGAPSRENVLIEKGMLRAYMNDKLSARLMGTEHTGNGRRESYQQMPMPRMTNTYMLAGEEDPGDIVRSVKRGLYAAKFGGGSVDITSGKFVFTASEAYLIEDGRITAPVRDATLIGNGPESLKYVSMVGNDLSLDEGVGNCGKQGQWVPVSMGMPTIKLDRMTVGGTGS
jgi:TldD protein